MYIHWLCEGRGARAGYGVRRSGQECVRIQQATRTIWARRCPQAGHAHIHKYTYASMPHIVTNPTLAAKLCYTLFYAQMPSLLNKTLASVQWNKVSQKYFRTTDIYLALRILRRYIWIHLWANCLDPFGRFHFQPVLAIIRPNDVHTRSKLYKYAKNSGARRIISTSVIVEPIKDEDIWNKIKKIVRSNITSYIHFTSVPPTLNSTLSPLALIMKVPSSTHTTT